MLQGSPARSCIGASTVPLKEGQMIARKPIRANAARLLPVEDRFDRRSDLIHRPQTVHPANEALGLVEWMDGRGLGAIFGKSVAHRFGCVIGPALEIGRATDIAY